MTSLRETIPHLPVLLVMDALIMGLDRFLAFTGLALSIALGAWAYVGGRYISELMAVLLGATCIFWLTVGRTLTARFPVAVKGSLRAALGCCFVLVFLATLAVWYFRPEVYERPALFFVAVTLLSMVIAIQVALSRDGGGYPVLLEVILLGFALVWSQTFLYPNVIGIDPIIHEAFTNQILATGHVPTGLEYSNFPLFHLVIAAGALLLGTGYPVAAALTVSLVQVVCVPFFVYLIGARVLRDPRAGLMGALLVVLAPENIFMGVNSIPNALTGVLLLVCLYLLLRYLREGDRASLLLACSFMVLAILTHTLTAIFLAVVLFVVWAISSVSITVLYDRVVILKRESFSLLLPVCYLLAVIGWWLRDEWMTTTLFQQIAEGFQYGSIRVNTVSYEAPDVSLPVENLIGVAGMYLFIFIALAGVFYLISRKYDRSNLIYAASALTPTAIVFASFLVNISIIQQRWWFFSEVLLAIPLGIAILLIAKSSRRHTFVTLGLAILLLGTTAFFCVITPDANGDSHVFTPNATVRNSLTASESQAVRTLAGSWNGTFRTDDLYATSEDYAGYPSSSFSVDLLRRDADGLRGDLVLVSNAIINKPFRFFFYTLRLDYDPDDWMEQQGFSRVYSAGYVNGYRDIGVKE